MTSCSCRKGAPAAGCPRHTVQAGDLGAASFKGPVPRPERTAGGVGQKKAKRVRRFRVKASPERWEQIRAAKLGPCLVCKLLGVEQLLPSSLHHVVAKSLGGSDTEANCVSVCGDGVRGHHGDLESHVPEVCQVFAAAVQLWDDAAYAYAIDKLGEDGFLRRYHVQFRSAA